MSRGWADLEVSATVQIGAKVEFYEPLAPHGVWVEVGTYGRCWRPARVAAGWRPYCEGRWVWTDCGWYWASDEPWAWACYHYGAWVHEPRHGWIWVPGVEWAPAWVHWRVGGDHIGWAPSPPRGIQVVPASFVFVGTHRFHDHVRASTVIANDSAIFKKTTLITKVERESRTFDHGKAQTVVINRGPDVAMVQKATGKKVSVVSIREADRRTAVPASVARSGRSLEPRERPRAAQDQPQSASGGTRGKLHTEEAAAPRGNEVGSSPQQPRSSDGDSPRSPAPARGKSGGKSGKGKG